MTEDQGGAASAGALLRAARERQGLHIAALAAAIKVAPRKLDALENNRWTELPDATFTRALAQTVCRTLKIDARPVLALLPPVEASALEDVGGHLNMPFLDRNDRSDGGIAGIAIRPMVWAAGALMLAAVAVYFVPERVWQNSAPAMVPVASVPAELPASAAAAMTGAIAVDAAASAMLPASQALGTTLASMPPTAVGAAPQEPAAPAVAVAGPIVLRSTQATWVDARDARGQVLLSRTMQAGETLSLDGLMPIRMIIGNATATELMFRGKAVDLSGLTQGNVARVEVQ